MKDWSKSIEFTMNQISTNSVIQLFIILGGTWTLAVLSDKLFLAWLRKVIAKKDQQNPLVTTKRSALFYSVMLLGLSIIIHLLKLPESVHQISQSILATMAILVWVRFLYRMTRFFLRGMAKAADGTHLVNSKSLPMFENTAFIFAIVSAFYFIFVSWNIDMTAWLASAGIIGIAVGFAAKDTLANLFSGLFIMADSPYNIGDMVVLDSGERGEITKIGIRSTRMKTRDDAEITIPNSIMGNTKILNESGGHHRKSRICVQVGIAYGSDIDKVRTLLMEIAQSAESLCQDPEPRVRFRRFGASGLDFELLCWIEEQSLRGRIIDDLNCTIYKRFAAESIEIPYTKQDLYIKEFPRAK